VGLGNPILGDDGVGLQIAIELQNIDSIPSDVTVECMAIGGISLMESLIGYDRAIIIDAIVTHKAPIGSVEYFKLGELPNPSSGHMSSAHDTSLQDALQIGRELGAYLPNDITVVTIESQKVYDFSETLTPPVAKAVPEVLIIIKQLLLEYYPAESQQLDGQSIKGGLSMITPELLRRYPFFGTLSDAQLKAMAMIAEEEVYEKGAVICEEGKPANAFYLLIEGGVSLYFKSEEEFHPKSRKDFLVGEIGPGEIFAISVLVEPYIYTATVKAECNSRVVKFNTADINGLIEKDPRLYCVLMREIAKAAMERLSFARVQLAAAWAK